LVETGGRAIPAPGCFVVRGGVIGPTHGMSRSRPLVLPPWMRRPSPSRSYDLRRTFAGLMVEANIPRPRRGPT